MNEHHRNIGEAAGMIYHALEKNERMTDAQLRKETGIADAALFNQAVGWLARENKISFGKAGRVSHYWLLRQPSGAF